MFAAFQVVNLPNGAPGTNEAVATAQAKAKPGRGTGQIPVTTAGFVTILQKPMDAAQPERKRAKFDSGGVEIHAIHIAGGDEMFDPADFVGILGRFHGPASLFLFQVKVAMGKLVSGFIEKGAASHCWLTDFQVQYPVGIIRAEIGK